MYIEGTVIVFIGHIWCKRKMNEQRVEHGRREKDYKKEIVASFLEETLHKLHFQPFMRGTQIFEIYVIKSRI